MKAVDILEQHIEKIVLVIVGLVCVWLLFTRVLFSPNVISYDGQKFGPGEIDAYIHERAKLLEEKLSQEPQRKAAYMPRLTGSVDPNDPVRQGIPGNLARGFVGLMDSAIGSVDTSVYPPLPYHSSFVTGPTGHYNLPSIGEVTDVAVGWIRAAAYVPTQQITEETPYDKATNEPNDVDFVTVEGKFDVADLYRRFEESFLGHDVPVEFRDPCLARPILSAVQLERQELLEDGSWSDWHVVPRTKIDHRARMFEIIEDVENLPPGGIKVRLLQFDDPEVRMDLLQPQAYQIASAGEEWFPPSLHVKFEKQREKDKLEEKRAEREEKEREREQERPNLRDDRRSRTLGTRSGSGSVRSGGTYEGYGGRSDLYGGYGDTGERRPRRGRRGDTRTDGGYLTDMGYGTDRGRPTDRRALTDRRQRLRPGERDQYDIGRDYLLGAGALSREPSINDIYREYDQALLTWRTDFAKMREPLLFWAHDDTVEPETRYRYRIRLGVLNPTAGPKQNQVILWSAYSDVTETVKIPARMYFFARDIQEAAKSITVEVARYVLGYWHSEDFAVRQGEAIGSVVESETSKAEPAGVGRYGSSRFDGGIRDSVGSARFGSYARPDEITEPEMVDYSTGAVLVDSVRINDWTGDRNLLPRSYHEMLYSFDGTNIEHMPIKPTNWPADLLAAFQEVKRLQREPKEPLRAWDSKVGGRRRTTTVPEGYEGIEGYEEMRMMEEMMMQQQMRPY